MPQPIVYTVSKLLPEIRQLLELSYPEIWVEGEIASLSCPRSGHYYFTLKDEFAQLACVMFKPRVHHLHFTPKVGDAVKIRAKMTAYPQTGSLQCQVQYMEISGEGALRKQFEKLKNTLEQEGLFSQAHKKNLPKVIRHIGVITSQTGAALHDIVSTLKRRAPFIDISIYHSSVQGQQAAQEMIQALKMAEQHKAVDALIISRGGGSMEDLWAFNNYQLAHAIYTTSIPTISAVGHEIDYTICDFVCDIRAATPTAAAEIISPNVQELQKAIHHYRQRLHHAIHRTLEDKAQKIDLMTTQLEHPKNQLMRTKNELNHLEKQIKLHYSMFLKDKKARFAHLQSGMHIETLQHTIEHKKNVLAHCQKQLFTLKQNSLKRLFAEFSSVCAQLNAVNPLATLHRGYSISRDAEGEVIHSKNQVKRGNSIQVEIQDAHLHCTVQSITNK